MAPRETAEDLAKRYERETRRVLDQRETSLENSLAPFRVGSVDYLNAVPLTRGLEEEIQFMPPSLLAEKLRAEELDAGLVSITEVLFNDRYEILDGIAIAALGEVKSVFLAHQPPLEEIRGIFCDTASLTSVNLLKVLLAERGLTPEFKPLSDYPSAPSLKNVLLIGDRAIEFLRGPHEHQIWDLGEAWFEMTRLPFVFAVWALLRGRDNRRLRDKLVEAKNFGLDTLDQIIATRPEFDRDFRQDYFTWHIQYNLGADEKRGIARFVELLRKHSGRPVFEPRFVV